VGDGGWSSVADQGASLAERAGSATGSARLAHTARCAVATDSVV